MPFIIMLASSIAIIALVKYGLVPGIDRVSSALGWSLKARGKATGYATSVPELVTLVAAGLSGVWDVGLWNIASSNMINLILATAALLYFRRGKDLMDRRFVQELSFAGLGILAPIFLMKAGLDTHWLVIPILLSLFIVYLMLDRGDGELPEGQAGHEGEGLWAGLAAMGLSLVAIILAGDFLGQSTKNVVQVMGVPAMVAGWVLGLVTSLPEAVTFFTVFSDRREAGCSDHKAQIQELLDNLAASNMSNSALIYPVGLLIYLLGIGLI